MVENVNGWSKLQILFCDLWSRSTFDWPEPRVSNFSPSSPFNVFCQTEYCCSWRAVFKYEFFLLHSLSSFLQPYGNHNVYASVAHILYLISSRARLTDDFYFSGQIFVIGLCLDHAFIQTKMVSRTEGILEIFIDCIRKVAIIGFQKLQIFQNFLKATTRQDQIPSY